MSFPIKVTIQNENTPPVVLYKTTGAYGGANDLIEAVEKFTNDIEIKNLQTNAEITFKFLAVSADTTDEPKFNLYKRVNDNIWEGTEGTIDLIQRANPGTEVIYIYTMGKLTHGVGNFRFGLVSSGGTTDFNVEVTIRYFNDEVFGS